MVIFVRQILLNKHTNSIQGLIQVKPKHEDERPALLIVTHAVNLDVGLDGRQHFYEYLFWVSFFLHIKTALTDDNNQCKETAVCAH